MGKFWWSSATKQLNRSIFKGKVQEAGLSAMRTYILTKNELAKLDSKMCKLRRALMKGSVVEDKPGHHKEVAQQQAGAYALEDSALQGRVGCTKGGSFEVSSSQAMGSPAVDCSAVW